MKDIPTNCQWCGCGPYPIRTAPNPCVARSTACCPPVDPCVICPTPEPVGEPACVRVTVLEGSSGMSLVPVNTEVTLGLIGILQPPVTVTSIDLEKRGSWDMNEISFAPAPGDPGATQITLQPVLTLVYKMVDVEGTVFAATTHVLVTFSVTVPLPPGTISPGDVELGMDLINATGTADVETNSGTLVGQLRVCVNVVRDEFIQVTLSGRMCACATDPLNFGSVAG